MNVWDRLTQYNDKTLWVRGNTQNYWIYFDNIATRNLYEKILIEEVIKLIEDA